ncbi:MAG: alpha-glucan phosphorylase [Deltaproteobacteria bacterium]|nr:MAG: alpha-glucan phosphorylase [Deltaproteobacteria bacterium]
MTQPIRTLDVKPRLPDALKEILPLSENLWFVWNHEATKLFRWMNPDLWDETRRNPVELLGRLNQDELKHLSEDEGFLAHMQRLYREFQRYMSARPNGSMLAKSDPKILVAYFTAECGVADCLPIYSGGLGILAGDYLKSTSDLHLPIIGVSLAYQKGYFRQYLTQDGWQMETYPENKFPTMPMKLVRGADGTPLTVAVDLKGENVQIQAWEVNIGTTRLYLLDTNLKSNSEPARTITSELYGGDREMRLRQEIILGIGGVRFLEAMGLKPSVYHMNEGHSAFAVFERIRQLREEEGLSFNEAVEFVRTTSVFTTHTPVAAGIDRFHRDLMFPYFESMARSMGISFDVLLAFGREEPRNSEEEFCMTVLPMRLSLWINGVSRLHAEISRKMWKKIWPNTPEADLPIVHITNGVHIPSWISWGMGEIYDRYLGPRWIEDPDNVKVWERVGTIPDTELWRTHERARERLVSFTRKRLTRQLAKRGASSRELAIANDVLNSEILTIGFARRFALYKRANLILRDMDRLEALLTNEKYPVQIIFAGKAHPQDQMAKDIIKQLVQTARRENLRRRMVFLEDYDMELASYMVQGVDIWLNTPRRPLEACGTSGMKAVANGALHLSVLDGWWDEGYDREIGWAIGGGEEYQDHDFQDEVESRALYDILEKDIIPLFYDRGPDGLPRGWLGMMKASLHKLCPLFNTHRMVEEYWNRFYLPATRQASHLMADGWKALKELAAWREKIMYNWEKIAIKDIRTDEVVEIKIGTAYHMEADIFLGELLPEDVMVEAYYGRLGPDDKFVDRATQVMQKAEDLGGQTYKYQCDIQFQESGHFGLTIRLTPNHPNPESRHSMGLVIWGKS